MPSSPESDTGEERASPASTVSEHNTKSAEERAAPELDELSAELARSEDRYKRALADLDNYRKRTAREIDRRVAEARESALRDWLEAVDSVERALRMQSDGPCGDGLRAVLDQMDAVLARQGAQRIGAAGEEFDPERHEAVAIRGAADVPDRTVLAVERTGLALGDRVIRPAQVVVARAPEHAR
jgi:molecular chaperone GrpE